MVKSIAGILAIAAFLFLMYFAVNDVRRGQRRTSARVIAEVVGSLLALFLGIALLGEDDDD